MEKKKFQVISTTEGCATNLLENSSYRQELENNGWESSDVNEAEVIILNTCGHTQEREDYTFDTLRSLKEQYPEKKIVVGGCLAKINPKGLDEIHKGKTFSPGNIPELWSSLQEAPDLVAIAQNEGAAPTSANLFDSQDFQKLTWVHRLVIKLRPYFFKLEKTLGVNAQPLHNILETTVVNQDFYGVTVSQGCAGKCTFCAIKIAKGHVKSKPLELVVSEFRKGIESGHDKFWLLGDDIGCYGIDQGLTIVDLLKEITAIQFPFKLVINYLEPMFFTEHFEELKSILSDPRIINMNIPIQSGNKRVVYKMGREYDPVIVLSQLKQLKKLNPNLVIKNNIIVGFPGESWSELFDSIKSLFFFDANLAIPFARRPGTRAAKMDNQISERGKALRTSVVNVFVLTRHAYVFLSSFLRLSKRKS